MKCPSCGAEISNNSKFCEFCGTQISYEMRREKEQLNKLGCPRCDSSNIEFTRENQGEVRDTNSKFIIHRTVGFCKDCGHTWYPDIDQFKNTSKDYEKKEKKKVLLWWILGWIFFFPAPIMVLIWRKKNTWSLKIKLAVTIIFWLLLIFIGSYSDEKTGSGSSTSVRETKSVEVTMVEASDELEKKERETEVIVSEGISAFRINELPVMNGNMTKRIGTYSMCYLLSRDCTEETLMEWWNEIKDKAYNWNIIRYADYAGDDNLGVYASNGIIEKNVYIADDGSVLGPADDLIVYNIEEDGKIKKME